MNNQKSPLKILRRVNGQTVTARTFCVAAVGSKPVVCGLFRTLNPRPRKHKTRELPELRGRLFQAYLEQAPDKPVLVCRRFMGHVLLACYNVMKDLDLGWPYVQTRTLANHGRYPQ